MKSGYEVGEALKKVFDECGLKTITPGDGKPFIGYDENGQFMVMNCQFEYQKEKE